LFLTGAKKWNLQHRGSEGGWHDRLNNILTEKMLRKNWDGGEQIKTRGKLTVTTFSTGQVGRDGSGGPLFP
jgi:hypothetical protein